MVRLRLDSVRAGYFTLCALCIYHPGIYGRTSAGGFNLVQKSKFRGGGFPDDHPGRCVVWHDGGAAVIYANADGLSGGYRRHHHGPEP